MNTAAKKPNQVPVLQFGQNSHLILELFRSLTGAVRQPLDSDFLAIWESPLEVLSTHVGQVVV